MKKGTIIILTFIILILTFILSEIFSIYHFGSFPTLLTFLYLILIYFYIGPGHERPRDRS